MQASPIRTVSWETAGYLPPSEAWPKAKAAAMQALDIDDSLAEAHTSLGLVKEHFEWDWAGAEREFKRAVELNPNSSTAHHWYGDYLSNMGRLEEGMRETKKALELDPLSLITNTTMGWQLYLAGQNDQAVDQLRKVLEIDPKFSPARRISRKSTRTWANTRKPWRSAKRRCRSRAARN